MQHKDAVQLLKGGIAPTMKSTWADLGCGEGTFTKALATLLSPGSTIYAIDKNKSALNHLPELFNEVIIQKKELDFVRDEIPWHNLHGILMANSLHFAKDKITLLTRISSQLNSSGKLLLVEYDLTHGNQWVPYPLPFEKLPQLAASIGFSKVIKLSERPSLYNRANIYSALLSP